MWKGAASSVTNASGAAGAPRPQPRDLQPDGRSFLRCPCIPENRSRASRDRAEGSHPHWGLCGPSSWPAVLTGGVDGTNQGFLFLFLRHC